MEVHTRFLLTILFLLLNTLNGNTVSAFSFKHITSRNGLTQSEVYSFLQDSRGMMWIGTLAGLNRFDGYSIKQYSIDRHNQWGLKNNTIRALAEDKSGNVWIGTDTGIEIFVPGKERFYQLPKTGSSDHVQYAVYQFLKDEHLLWAVTQKGLLLFDTRLLEFDDEGIVNFAEVSLNKDKNQHAFLNQPLHYISKISDNRYIVGNYGTFICFRFENNKFKPTQDLDKLKNTLVSASFHGLKQIIEDKEKNLWILSLTHGVARMTHKTAKVSFFSANNKTHNQLSSNFAQCAILDLSGNLWIGTLDNGINYIPVSECSKEIINIQHIKNNALNRATLGSNLIYSLYTSSDGNVWIGTIGAGVSYFNPFKKNFRLYRIPPGKDGEQNSNFIRSIIKESSGLIWLGLHNDGLFVYSPETNFYKKIGLGKVSVMHLYEDAYGRDEILIASLRGFHIFNSKTMKPILFDGFNSTRGYFNILQTNSDTYWLAGLDGIKRLSRSGNIFETTHSITDTSSIKLRIPQKNTRVLCYDKKRNTLWAGSEGGGLYRIVLSEQQKIDSIHIYSSDINLPGSLSNNFVRSLCIVEDELWIGTYDGLNMLNLNNLNEGFKTFTTKDGLSNNMIQSIESFRYDLWIGTNGGLTCFNIKTKKAINYNYSDGLQSNEFSEHTSYKTVQGMMLFGGIDGFNIFHPGNILNYKSTPSVVITNISVNNQDIVPLRKINNRVIVRKQIFGNDTLLLKHNENNIQIVFASPFFASPEKVKYRYMLEGLDKYWQETQANMRFANYTNLRHGKYFLKISASNGEDEWNEPTILLIDIQTPFYFTWWAFLLYAAFIFVVVYYLANFSIIKITEKNKLLLEHDHNLQIESLNEQRTRFFINISHELRTPVTLIANPLKRILSARHSIENVDKELEIVLRNAQRLKILTDQLLDFRKIELGALNLNMNATDFIRLIEKTVQNFIPVFKERGVNVKLDIPSTRLDLSIDADKIEKAICNILSNMLKYTPENGVAGVRIYYKENTSENDTIVVEMYDSGPGIPESDLEKVFDRFYTANDDKAGYGIGLHYTREIVSAHGGEIKAMRPERGGAAFILTLPVIIQQRTDIDNQSKYSYSNEIAEIMVSPESVTNVFAKNKPTVMIVEDNADMRNYLSKLMHADYNIVIAVDGSDAILKLKSGEPDVIISDIMMPIMNGLELCDRLKSDFDTSHIPLILLTARDDMETKFSGYDKGADAYILKPFDDDFLLLRVRKLIEARSKMRAEFKQTGEINQIKTEINSHDQKFIDKVIRFVDENLDNEEFSIDTLESLVGVSHSSMFRKMKALFGMSGIEFLQERRLNKALELLKSKQFISVSDVAYGVGYSNPKYFSRCFKEKFGKKPSDYLI